VFLGSLSSISRCLLEVYHHTAVSSSRATARLAAWITTKLRT